MKSEEGGKVWHVPIEPYEERYTEQWLRWWPEGCRKAGLPYYEILSEALTDKIVRGEVLDVYGTHYWKATQLRNIITAILEGAIRDQDVIFFHDLWFPGIEALQYIRDMENRIFRIEGILHAGTWDHNDFLTRHGMRPWARWIETGWLKMFDRIFVGSQYHKDLILKGNPAAYPDIRVTGLPFEAEEVRRLKKKKNIVVFPHRLDPEKQPELFDNLEQILKMEFRNWRFVKTKDVCKTKGEYYNLLSEAKIAVSFAKQETFGYAMLESMANGCIPLVPNSLSYSTMPIYKGFRYEDFSDCVRWLRVLMKNWECASPNFKLFQNPLREFETVDIVRRMFLER